MAPPTRRWPITRSSSAGADVKAAEYQREAAKFSYYPRFDLELGYGNNKNLDGVKGDNDEKYAMLRMRYNLFRGGSDMARAQARRRT